MYPCYPIGKEPFKQGFEHPDMEFKEDAIWRKEPSKQLLQIRPDYSIKIQRKCQQKYGPEINGKSREKSFKSSDLSSEECFSATDCSFDSCEISMNSDHSPEVTYDNLLHSFPNVIAPSLNSSSCGFRTYLTKGQLRRKLCYYCYDMEYRNCLLRNEEVPSLHHDGIWNTHTTYNMKGRLTCPLLHFLQRFPPDSYESDSVFGTKRNNSNHMPCRQEASNYSTCRLDSREMKSRCFKF